MTWTPEQAGQRREWDLDALDADPRNLATVDPMDAVMRKRAERENGSGPPLDTEGLSTPDEDVDLPGQLEDQSVPLSGIDTSPPPPMLIDRLDPNGHTILYGTGGVGKGALACWWIVQLARIGYRVLILDYEKHPEEWSRRIASLDRRVHETDMIRHLAPSDPIKRAATEIAWTCETHDLDLIIVDSAVMACGADPLKPEAAAEYASALLDIGRPVLSLAHVTKVDDSRYPFGSIFWHNLARTTWSLTGDEGETLLRHRKHNNYQGLGSFSLAITWSEEGQLQEVWERGYNMTILARALDVLTAGPAMLAEILTAINDDEHKPVARESLRRTLAKAIPFQVRVESDRYVRV